MAGSEGHRAVSRALHALEIAVASEDGVTLRHLADEVGAAKSSLHPLLKALVFREYLTYEGTRFRSGPMAATASLGGARTPNTAATTPALQSALARGNDQRHAVARSACTRVSVGAWEYQNFSSQIFVTVVDF
jgi:DNA-binding IclR family transcriptional regulator